MKILYVTKKGRLMNTIEKFHVDEETAEDNQINDRNTVQHNVIFEKILRVNTHRGRPTGQPSY